jgi:hypothetical protein
MLVVDKCILCESSVIEDCPTTRHGEMRVVVTALAEVLRLTTPEEDSA